MAFVVVGASGGGWRGLSRAIRAEPVAVWVRDRGARADFGLDENAVVVARRPHAGTLGPVPPLTLPSGLTTQLAERQVEVVAAALDRKEWDRARQAAWVLVREPSANPRRTVVNAGQFLERWVLTGTPLRWQRAFRMRLPWESRALVSRKTGVWVGAARRCALRFFGHDGTLLVDEELLDADGIEALAPALDRSGGGVWAVAGGAVVRLRRDGRRLPGQGGFAHLVMVQVANPAR